MYDAVVFTCRNRVFTVGDKCHISVTRAKYTAYEDEIIKETKHIIKLLEILRLILGVSTILKNKRKESIQLRFLSKNKIYHKISMEFGPPTLLSLENSNGFYENVLQVKYWLLKVWYNDNLESCFVIDIIT